MSTPKRPIQLLILAVITALEGAFMAAVTVELVVELVVSRPDSLASALALIVLTAVAAVALIALALKTLQARPWVRGAIVTWQLIQLAIGVESLTGPAPNAVIGIGLIVPVILAIVLLFTPPVMRALQRDR